MIIKNEIITDLKIRSVKDLYKTKPFMEGTSLRINKSLNKEGVTFCWNKHVCIVVILFKI